MRIFAVFLCFVFLGAELAVSKAPLDLIAFGSCNHQDKQQPLWPVITAAKPDLWIWTGDVIYGDTSSSSLLRSIYQKQTARKEYQKFIQAVPRIIGTWDDHDYADNNSDRTALHKHRSQQEFLNFLGEPENSPRRRQKGIYWHYHYGDKGRKVAIYLFDTRYHKDPWSQKNGTILGHSQWQWLRNLLSQEDADLNLFVSSIQVLPTQHPFEKWQNFPQERQRLLDEIVKSKVKNPVFISGDRHIAEISHLNYKGLDFWEVTSSGLTHSYKEFSGEKNSLRVGQVFFDIHFGEIAVDWTRQKATLRIKDRKGHVVLSQPLDI